MQAGSAGDSETPDPGPQTLGFRSQLVAMHRIPGEDAEPGTVFQSIEPQTGKLAPQAKNNARKPCPSLLGGSWVVISGVISRVTIIKTAVPLMTTHEPPSKQETNLSFGALLEWGQAKPAMVAEAVADPELRGD